MTVLLVTNPTKDSGYAVTGQAAALLHELGVAVVMAQPVFESKVPIRFLPEEEAYREADFVITIGGDGTLLKAGLDCVHYGKPVLGVNLGRTGFLATCEVEEMPEKLRLLAEGRYTLDPRGLLLARSANGCRPKPSTMWCFSAAPACTRWTIKSTATAALSAATAAMA